MNIRSSQHYDLAVVGAGSAGFAAAIAAAELGAEVALIGAGMIGGTCVNTGCIPSKALIRAAESLHQIRAASRFSGITGSATLADWRVVLRQKDELVGSLRERKYSGLLPAYDTLHYIEGKARLAKNGVSIKGTTLEAEKLVIATGASPALPAIAGIGDVPCLTSTTALVLEALPRSLLVIGGGSVGCELGQMFARFGVRVTIIDLLPILSSGEPEISRVLAGSLRGEGIKIQEGVRLSAIRKGTHGIVADFSADGRHETLATEAVLVATGRRPNTADFGLAEAEVLLRPNGGIAVDEHMRTTRPGTYAAGDVTGDEQFVYMAAHGGRIAALNALNGDGLCYDNRGMPRVVFTDPQAASAGLTEAAARAAGYAVQSAMIDLDQVARALAARDTRGLVKLVAEAGTGKLLGAHILAPEGADSIQTAVLAIRHDMTVEQLGAAIFPYLTTVEGLKLAAQAFTKDLTKLSCCAG